VRQATKLELHQISVDAARAVLHEKNLAQMVEHATRRLVGERFADPAVAAASLEPLLPEVRDAAREAATTTAGAMIDVVRLDVELARAEVVGLAATATETAQRALEDAREEVRTLAEEATTTAESAIADTRDEVRALAKDAAAKAEAAVEDARHEVRALVTDATEKARRAVRDARDEVRALAEEASARTEAAVEAARAQVIELARDAAEKAAAEYVPRPVEVRLPDGRHHRVTGHTHQVLPELLLALGARCHVLLVGPAGTGKSMLATHAAEALGLELQGISLGPTTPMSKVFGYYDAHGNYHATPFRRAFEHGGVMLLDELDNGHPGLLAELNQALALGVCAFADGMVAAHPDFRLVATGNTYGTGGDRQYVGRQALDAATLDRFVTIDVPVDEHLEERVAMGLAPGKKRLVRQLLTEVRRLRKVAGDKQLPVMFSPRVSYDGARLLAAGATLEQVLSWRVIRGLSTAHRSSLGLS
jgi:MoxR-like ATPase